VYELNLPPFNEIVQSTFSGFLESTDDYVYIAGYDQKNIVKEEFLKLKNIPWGGYRYFKKSNRSGSIHSDANYEPITDPNKCIWGINWIFDGSGLISYWDWKNVYRIGNTPGSQNLPKDGVVPKFFTNKLPDFSYANIKNKAYLVNATVPHRATGELNRKAFSLRPRGVNYNWENIVELFSDLII
jgi:hypothetical protein